MNLNWAKRLSYIFLYDIYGSNIFNHKEHKVLRQAQDNSTKVHKVNILNVLINLSELELSEATFLNDLYDLYGLNLFDHKEH